MELTKIYASILEALHVRATPEGMLSYDSFSGPVPLTVRDGDQQRRLVLPTDDVLREADWDAMVPFHPLSEHLNRGVSPVMNTLVKAGTLRLTEVISSLLHQLIKLAAEPKRHEKMAPQAQKILSAIPDANVKTLEVLEKILKRIDMTPDRKLVSIYLKRKGVYKGMTGRVCVIGFPIMDELSNPERTVWGVKLSQKEINTIEAVMQYILPNCDDVESYSALSDSQVAPYFESFLEAYEKVATQLNKVVHTNRKELELVEKLTTKLDWGNLSEDLYKYRSTIPPLDGNKGTVLDDRSQEAAAASEAPARTGTPAPTMVHPAASPMIPAQPVLPPSSHPVRTVSDGEESMADKLARQRAKTMPVQPAGYPPPGYPAPAQYPVQGGYPMPGYPPQQMVGYPPGVPMGYPPQAGYPMAMAPVQMPGYPYPVQGQVPPGYPVQYVDPNQPVWMNNPNGHVVAGRSPAPIQPGAYGMPSGTGGLLFS